MVERDKEGRNPAEPSSETRAVSTISFGRAAAPSPLGGCQKKVFQDPDIQRYKSRGRSQHLKLGRVGALFLDGWRGRNEIESFEQWK